MRRHDHLIPPLEFLVAVVAAIVIAGIAAVALNSAQRDAEIAYHSTTGVRI
jgi:hypothetical protein